MVRSVFALVGLVVDAVGTPPNVNDVELSELPLKCFVHSLSGLVGVVDEVLGDGADDGAGDLVVFAAKPGGLSVCLDLVVYELLDVPCCGLSVVVVLVVPDDSVPGAG